MKLFVFIFLLCFQSLAQDQLEKSTGRAYSSKGKLIYIEKHEVKKNQDKMVQLKTQYYTPSGIYFGKIESDFSKNPYIPLYNFEDIRFDRIEGI